MAPKLDAPMASQGVSFLRNCGHSLAYSAASK
jgi:hypothetical protein